MAERIYLIGFMGAGKTTVGRVLARQLGWFFVDLDDEIERAEGRSVADVFRESGQPYFRELESRLLRKVSRSATRVVALGGGVYADPDNRAYVEAKGLSVYLETALESIQARVDDDGGRPLFSGSSQVAELYQERLPSYRMAAVTVNTDGSNPEDVASRILRLLNIP